MCGIVGIVSKQAVAVELHDSLIQLQHRGQAAAGIVTVDQKIHTLLGKGLVREVCTNDGLSKLTGHMGLGHVRYPTHGDSGAIEETQPFWCSLPYGMAMAHNGNLVNYQELKRLLQQQFRRYLNTESDSEALLNLFSVYLEEAEQQDPDTEFFQHLCDAVSKVFAVTKGSYSTIGVIAGKGLLAFRDPHGVRPLVMGKRGEDEYILASENTPFFSLGFEVVADVKPGEVVFIDTSGQVRQQQLTKQQAHPCIFEYIYFSRPDAVLDTVSVYRTRLALGKRLAEYWRASYPEVIPDVVIPVPFSSNTAAQAFAAELGVRYSEGLYKNPFIGRTFIMDKQSTRQQSVRRKLSPQHTEIKNKNVLLLDDSIVRGTTSREIVRMVREVGAKSVYFASTAPEIRYPCYYGINIPTSEELIASKLNLAQLTDYLDVDILLYQRQQDLLEAVAERGSKQVTTPCLACMNQHYYCGKPSYQEQSKEPEHA